MSASTICRRGTLAIRALRTVRPPAELMRPIPPATALTLKVAAAGPEVSIPTVGATTERARPVGSGVTQAIRIISARIRVCVSTARTSTSPAPSSCAWTARIALIQLTGPTHSNLGAIDQAVGTCHNHPVAFRHAA